MCWLAGFWVSVLKAILCPKKKMVIIFGAPNCDLGGLLHPGRPWEQQEGHVGIQGRIFSDFGMILGPHFESFSGTEG